MMKRAEEVINSQAMQDTRETSKSNLKPDRRRFLHQTIGVSIAAPLGLRNTLLAKEPSTLMTTFINPRLFTFVGGDSGTWTVIARKTVIGEPLPLVKRLDIIIGGLEELPEGAQWMLRGVTSNERYVTRSEKDQLATKQVSIGRPEATHAALIPIRKNAKWWALTQDERRAIFEERSHHVQTGLKYLPAIARRLHHCRDLGENQPFDFITLFDYAPADATAFEDMVAELRTTEEWKYVEREIDIRVVREGK